MDGWMDGLAWLLLLERKGGGGGRLCTFAEAAKQKHMHTPDQATSRATTKSNIISPLLAALERSSMPLVWQQVWHQLL